MLKHLSNGSVSVCERPIGVLVDYINHSERVCGILYVKVTVFFFSTFSIMDCNYGPFRV